MQLGLRSIDRLVSLSLRFSEPPAVSVLRGAGAESAARWAQGREADGGGREASFL